MLLKQLLQKAHVNSIAPPVVNTIKAAKNAKNAVIRLRLHRNQNAPLDPALAALLALKVDVLPEAKPLKVIILKGT
jgi:hypothetical protein